MRIHIVQKGDILSEIAKKYNVEFDELVKMNPQLSSPDMIMPGMKIKIPSESKQVRSSKEQRNYQDIKVGEEVDKTQITDNLEAKTPERPMGAAISDDGVRKKPMEAKIPSQYEPLYPVKPNTQANQIASNTEETLLESKKEFGNKDLISGDQIKKMDMQPQTTYRPMNSPPPMHVSVPPTLQPGMPSMYTHRLPIAHHCCCCCHNRHPMFHANQPSIPEQHAGTYYFNHNGHFTP